MGLGETIWRWEQRRAERDIERFGPDSIVDVETPEDIVMDDIGMDSVSNALLIEDVAKATEEGLEGLLPLHEVAVIKAALGTLELEEAVNELLGRNRRALARLEALQRLRIGSEDGALSQVEEGSEEWDVGEYSRIL